MSLARVNTVGSNAFADRENVDSSRLRQLAVKAGLTTAGARTALGNVSNKASLHSQPIQKGLKEGLGKPRAGTRVSARQKLAGKEKENAVTIKPDVKPEPVKKVPPKEEDNVLSMDISSDQAFSRQLICNVQDIDKADRDNPQLVTEYVNDIYNYMMMLEKKMSVKPHYMEDSNINGRMRGILVDWLVQVHLRFGLLQETLYLTVSLIDRFLQLQEVSKNKLQLVGVTAMLLASKYEEMYAPEINDFVYITDNAYSKTTIMEMERFMLKTLGFNMGKPLPLHFLRRDSKAGEVDAKVHTLAKYLMELTIVDYEMVHHPPSLIAAAALWLSMSLLHEGPWSDTLVHYSKYSEADVMPVVRQICVLITKAGSGKLTAIKTKYGSSKFMRIAGTSELNSKLVTDLAAQHSH